MIQKLTDFEIHEKVRNRDCKIEASEKKTNIINRFTGNNLFPRIKAFLNKF